MDPWPRNGKKHFQIRHIQDGGRRQNFKCLSRYLSRELFFCVIALKPGVCVCARARACRCVCVWGGGSICIWVRGGNSKLLHLYRALCGHYNTAALKFCLRLVLP